MKHTETLTTIIQNSEHFPIPPITLPFPLNYCFQ